MGEVGTELAARSDGLSSQQARFVEARLRGRSIEEAMSDAGYAAEDWMRVIQDPAIASACESGVRSLAAHGAVDAIVVFTDRKKSLTAADRVAVDAARAVLGIAGHVAPTRVPQAHRTANLAEMGSEDLRALVDQLQGELAVRSAPNAPRLEAKPLNVLD